MPKKIVFTGGGTVGHVTLNLLLMPKFIADGWEVHYIGDPKGVEHQQLVSSGLAIRFHGIATGKLRRYFSWQNVCDVFKVAFGVLQSLMILARLRPDALFSKGGFVSVPPVIAARVLRIPVFIHESDLSMGLANKIAYRFATTLYTTFEQDKPLPRTKHVGAVTKIGTSEHSYEAELRTITAFFDPQKKTVLFIGGSGGARVFNRFVTDHPELTKRYNVINITGDSSLNTLSQGLYRVDYVRGLYQPLLALADFVVTRGGANTLFELLAMKKLSLIVPLGTSASRGDQLENAAYFEKKGYALTLMEEQLDVKALDDKLSQLLSDQDAYLARMAQSSELTSVAAFYTQLLKDMGGN